MQKSCSNNNCNPFAWHRSVILGAALIGLIFSAWAIFWPKVWFSWCDVSGACDEMWMTVGMLNGVIAIGLLIASTKPIQHWPVIMLATIAKVGATVGFTWAVWRGVFPLPVGWVILLNDAIWIIPFLMILWASLETHLGRQPHREEPYTLAEALENYNLGEQSLMEASKQGPLTIVFLRHFGCTFTRQLLRGLDGLKKESEANGSTLVLVHMLQSGKEHEYIDSTDVARVADPYCELYRAFGLGKGGVWELFGPRVVLQGVMALIQGCGVGHLAGDGLQLPGAFVVRDGVIVSSQKARDIADLPKLEELFTTEVNDRSN